MTVDEAFARIRQEIKTIQDWGCFHQDEFGTYYAPDAEQAFQEWEDVLEALEGAIYREGTES